MAAATPRGGEPEAGNPPGGDEPRARRNGVTRWRCSNASLQKISFAASDHAGSAGAHAPHIDDIRRPKIRGRRDGLERVAFSRCAGVVEILTPEASRKVLFATRVRVPTRLLAIHVLASDSVQSDWQHYPVH